MRDAFDCFEFVGSGDCLYGSGECAGSCDRDADGQVWDGYKQDRGDDDNCYGSSARRHVGKSDERNGTECKNAKC